MNSFDSRNFRLFLPDLLGILLGAIMIARPSFLYTAGARLLGLILLVIGIVGFAGRAAYGGRYTVSFQYIACAAAVIAGILLLTRHRSIRSFFAVIIGIYILANGLLQLSEAMNGRSRGTSLWTVPAALGLLSVLAGIFMLIHPIRSMNLFTRFMGVTIVYSAVVGLLRKLRAGI